MASFLLALLTTFLKGLFGINNISLWYNAIYSHAYSGNNGIKII
jgi:hypothetical protein